MRLDFLVPPAPSQTPVSEPSLSLRRRLWERVFLGLKGRSGRPRRPLLETRFERLRGGDDATLQASSSSVRSETSPPSAMSPSHSSSENDLAERDRCLEGLFSFLRFFRDILMKTLGREPGWILEADGSKAESAPIFFLYSSMQQSE